MILDAARAHDAVAVPEAPVPGHVRCLLYASVVAVVFLRSPFRLGSGLVAADLLIGALIVGGWGIAIARDGPAQPMVLRLVPWLWLFVLANLIGLSHAGLASWGVLEIVKNSMPFVVIAAAYGLLRSSPHLWRRVWRLWLVVSLLEAIYILIESGAGGARSGGTFGNPNYPAHYLTLTVIAAFVLERWSVRLIVTAIIGVAVLRTGSFSPFPMLAASLCYWGWSWSARLEPAFRLVVRVLLGIIVLATIQVGMARIATTEFEAGSGLDSSRLERSSESRFDIWVRGLDLWEARPMGWGPGYIGAAKEAGLDPLGGPGEVHQDVLDTLVASGPIGVLALVMLVKVIWTEGKRGGGTRTMMVALAAAGLFRQTLNFRHTALLLAIVLASDHLTSDDVRRPPTRPRHTEASRLGRSLKE